MCWRGYGGDGFVILTLHTRLEAARIRHAIHGAAFTMIGHSIAPSASIGIAAFPESGDAAADVLEKADIALYQSKQSGRDRVTVYRVAASAVIIPRLLPGYSAIS